MKCAVDVSEINAALQFAQQWSSRTAAQCINTCAVAVLNRTIDLTPFVSIDTIDTELATQVYYVQTKTGRESTAVRNRRYKGGISSIQQIKRVPLAVLIILARANRAGLNRGRGDGTTSNYNIRTNNRWALAAILTASHPCHVRSGQSLHAPQQNRLPARRARNSINH